MGKDRRSKKIVGGRSTARAKHQRDALAVRVANLEAALAGALRKGDFQRCEELAAVRRSLLLRKKGLDRSRPYPADAVPGPR